MEIPDGILNDIRLKNLSNNGMAARNRPSGFLSAIRSLPPFHPVATEALRLLCSAEDGVDVDEVAHVLGDDPAFAAEMLQTANSPLFGFQRSVHSIGHAIIILGLDRTRALAIRTAMQMYLKDAADNPALQPCWLHSLACAEIAKILMTTCGRAGNDQAYTAGLLHDIGRFVLLKSFRSEYPPVLNRNYQAIDELINAERQAMGIDHCEAGHEICLLWSFPPQIGEIALHHHENVSGQENSTLNLVRLSCQFADSLGFSAFRCGQRPKYEQLISALAPQMRCRFEVPADELRQMVLDRVGHTSAR
jgi:putative nucleotidyltransferase with HDIG domain